MRTSEAQVEGPTLCADGSGALVVWQPQYSAERSSRDRFWMTHEGGDSQKTEEA